MTAHRPAAVPGARGSTPISGRRGRGLVALALAAVLALASTPALAQPAPGGGVHAYEAKAKGNLARVLDRATSGQNTTFWVKMDSRADDAAARKARSKTAKGRSVYDTRRAHAKQSQAGLVDLLKDNGAHYTSFWISNAVKVTADKSLADKIAARNDVAALYADDPTPLPKTMTGKAVRSTDPTEWNVDQIRAPKVWDELGVRGGGIVIGSIDTGVQYTHPALAASYRGTKADGSYDHAYNFYDPYGVCPGDGPCDDQGHGTHTMGTMVGDGGTGNRIGVAPGARWIAAKGCVADGCDLTALLMAGQWMIAPADPQGNNPRPDLAPDVINNSWGGAADDPFYEDMVNAWRDAGIFPSFSNGNDGPDCNTTGSPGGYSSSYSTGAYDNSGAIAWFSSRGTGRADGVKPNISAPGVNVRSSMNDGGYAVESGTSMAAPHTTATVALMWSASPALRGNVAETERILNESAVDTDDTSCGGSPGNNNVYGEGKLDAYAAVSAAPRGAVSELTGKVTSAGAPLADATVVLDGPLKMTVTTGDDGTYRLPKVAAGEYKATVSKYGYGTVEDTLTIADDATLTRDFALDEAPSATITGTVRSAGGPEAGAAVAAQDTPRSVTTGDDGTFRLTLPKGQYALTVTPAHRCSAAVSVTLDLTGDTTRNVELTGRTDGSGTTCTATHDSDFPRGEKKLSFANQYQDKASVDLPFPVALYGKTYRKADITTEGYVDFDGGTVFAGNTNLPSQYVSGALLPFWDDLQPGTSADAGVYWTVRGSTPHRSLLVEWRDVTIGYGSDTITFSAEISEDGTVVYRYKNAPQTAAQKGTGATIGMANGDGSDAFEYSYVKPVLSEGLKITFDAARSAKVAGLATDANDGDPVSGTDVSLLKDGQVVATDTTQAEGGYLFQVPADDEQSYTVSLKAAHYEDGTRDATAKPGSITYDKTALRTGKVAASTDRITLAIPKDETRARTYRLTNSGSATAYSVKEKDGAGWLRVTDGDGTLASGATRDVKVTYDTKGAAPGTVLHGTLQIVSDSGRTPVVEIPVTVAVPLYQAALDSGGKSGGRDSLGDAFSADKAYQSGSFGYIDGSALSTTKDIAGTGDDALLRTARQGALEYRFDDVPDGVYRVDLDFAEIGGKTAGKRVFSVLAEGDQKISYLDLVLEKGQLTADRRTFEVKVTDGTLNLRFVATTGKSLVNAVRVTQRPDLSG
ncbi:S8 family serine peptidase [Streptomyces sp. NBC_00063]|uniref:S8 family serine peptidase n=1 Tax=Streptomyces sp. NBC_00063 TaxID=2975638 RepID=UPI003D713C78